MSSQIVSFLVLRYPMTL